MSAWDWVVRDIAVPLGGVLIGWIAQKVQSKKSRERTVALGEQFARYADAAARMTVIAARAGHVPMEAARMVEAWRVRFVALAKAAGHNPTPEVVTRATGKALRSLLYEIGDDGKAVALVAALETALLATDMGRDL